MTPSEKVAYLKGLMEGSDLKWDKKESKIIETMVELLGDLASSVSEMDDDISVLYDDMDSLSEAVDELDETLYYLSDEDDEDDEDEDDEDENFTYEVVCEKCGNTIVVDEETLLAEEPLSCPSCGEAIELEIDCDGCGDASCTHDHGTKK